MKELYPWLVPYYAKITHAFKQGFGHHALLFKAESGLGVEELIAHIANFLMCQNSALSPCGQCHHCHLMQAKSHPDFYLLASIEGKDIGVEQVREITDKLNQHAQQGGNKVVWIQGAERLTESAGNALLKTLEEPRPQTYFLLQTDVATPLLATIYSRCQPWLIAKPCEEVSLAFLAQAFAPKNVHELRTALQMNFGRPLSALNFLQENTLAERTAFLRHFWLFYSRRSPLELLPYFDKEKTWQQLDWLESFLVDALKCKLGIRSHWQCEDIAQGVEKFALHHSPVALLQSVKIIQQIRQDLRQINGVNQEIILLEGLCKFITQIFAPSTQH